MEESDTVGGGPPGADSGADGAERRAGARDYLFDMLTQMAVMARNCGEHSVAVTLAMAVLEGKHSRPGGGRH